jgi:hypothetical protein
MNTNSGLVKTLVVLSLIAGIIGIGMALTPVKMMAMIPSLFAFIMSVAAYFIAKAKQGKLLVIYVALLISIIGSATALVREYAIKDKVVVDQKFEEKKEQSTQEGDNDPDLDENLKDLE